MSDIPHLGVQDIDWQGGAGRVMYPEKRQVEFFTGTKVHGLRSQEEGRPVHVPVTMIRVYHPGERDPVVVEAREHHKYEFPRHWAAFEAGEKAEAIGTPLSILYPSDDSMVRSLRSLHIFTVEQLAGLTESGIHRLGLGGRGHVERAKEYLAAASSMVGNHRLQAALDAETAKREAMEREMEVMRRQLEVLAAAATEAAPRRGRPPKDQTQQGDE